MGKILKGEMQIMFKNPENGKLYKTEKTVWKNLDEWVIYLSKAVVCILYVK